MIHVPAETGRPAGGTARLIEALRGRGEACVRSPEDATGGTVGLLVCGEGGAAALEATLSRWRSYAEARLLVLSRIGAHRDARAAALRALWDLEERARAGGLPVLTLRLGPVVGPASPLWLRLRARPSLPGQGRMLLNPVAEDDVVETLERALADRVEWSGWYEVAGPEVWSLAELASLAAGSAPALPPGSGAWEPPLAEMAEHRLAEAGPWLGHFRLAARPLADQARSWSALPQGSLP